MSHFTDRYSRRRFLESTIAKLGVLGFDQRLSHVAIPELNNIWRLHTIRAALEKGGFSSREVQKIMGGNWARVLAEPVGPPSNRR